jgi:hypothetical protein
MNFLLSLYPHLTLILMIILLLIILFSQRINKSLLSNGLNGGGILRGIYLIDGVGGRGILFLGI